MGRSKSGQTEVCPTLAVLQQRVVACDLCPRLRAHCTEMARVKRRAYRDHDYWGKPVPSWGDPDARLLIVGLAPAAHGANRTGRMFTGDSSGDFLYRALHGAGFASQPTSVHPGDGLTLRDCYISASGRCAPPDNKPTPEELRNCRPFLAREFELLTRLRVVVALGRIAFDTCLSILREQGRIASRSAFHFGHNVVQPAVPGAPLLISSYHPSRQNTSTGKLTDALLLAVFKNAARLLARSSG